MTRGEMIATIAARLGQRADLEVRARAELQLEQLKLEMGPLRPWFLKKRTAVTLTQPFAVPTDYIAPVTGVSVFWLSETPPVPLVEVPEGAMSDPLYSESGRPKYYFFGEAIWFLPGPSVEHNVGFTYYYAKQPQPATDNDTNVWLTHAPLLMVARVGLQLAKFLRSPENVTLFLNDAQEAYTALHIANVAHEVSSGFLEMGG